MGAEALRPAPSAQPAAGTASGAAPAPALGPARPGWVLPAAFPSALAPSASGALTPGSGETDEPTPSPAPLTVRSVGAFPGPRSHTDVIAFYVNWDDASLLSLKQHVTSLDKLIPEWLHLVGTPAGTDPAGGDAGVSLGVAGEASSDANAQRTFARDDRAKEKAVLDYLQDARPTLPVVPLINNYDPEMQDWDSEALGQMLATPLTRARTIRSLLDYVRSEDLAGIHIDFEAVPPDSQPALVDFMRELYLEFHPLGLERRRAEVLRRIGRLGPDIEAFTALPADAARARLREIPGIGPWTAAEATRVAFGDPDAVSVGDAHLPDLVAWALAGQPRADDARMLELLEPYRGQRARVVRLLEAAGIKIPRFGPRFGPRRIAEI